MRKTLRPPLLAACALLCAAAPARADRVDGQWCDAEGRRVVIEGDGVTTPGGVKTIGENRRHVFTYDAPEGETPSGHVRFQQLNDDLMRSTSQDSATPREWRRCRPVS